MQSRFHINLHSPTAALANDTNFSDTPNSFQKHLSALSSPFYLNKYINSLLICKAIFSLALVFFRTFRNRDPPVIWTTKFYMAMNSETEKKCLLIYYRLLYAFTLLLIFMI